MYRGVSLSQPTAGSKNLPARQLRRSRTGHHEDTEDSDKDFISNSKHKSGKVISFFFVLAIIISRIAFMDNKYPFIDNTCSFIDNAYPFLDNS